MNFENYLLEVNLLNKIKNLSKKYKKNKNEKEIIKFISSLMNKKSKVTKIPGMETHTWDLKNGYRIEKNKLPKGDLITLKKFPGEDELVGWVDGVLGIQDVFISDKITMETLKELK